MKRVLTVLFLGVFALSASAYGQGLTGDPYKAVFDSVSQQNLEFVLKNMTGYLPVTVGGKSFSIKERYTPSGKANFRAYWVNYFQSLGIDAQEMPYATSHWAHEKQGHNAEAILPGKSTDTIVLIVHYDSIGKYGQEALNPGVDDDMTGMAMMLETARLLAPLKGQLQHTVRFVAVDFEEWGGLEGSRKYATYLKKLAQTERFNLIAAVDFEQSGWSGATNNGDKFNVYSCGGPMDAASKPLGDQLAKIATTYSTLIPERDCIGEHSDHYAMWEVGIPAVVFSEYNPFSNPHFDRNGGDTYDRIDLDYFFRISQVAVTFAVQLVGL